MSQKPSNPIKDNFSYSNDLVSNCNSFLIGCNTPRYDGTDMVSAVHSNSKLWKVSEKVQIKPHGMHLLQLNWILPLLPVSNEIFSHDMVK